MRLLPVFVLALALGTFMTADRLWLHWYSPDTSPPVANRAADKSPLSATPLGSLEPSVVGSGAQTKTPVPAPQSHDALVALWAASQQASYRVRYETFSASGDEGDSYDIFSRPPLARVDTIPAGASEPSSQIIVGRDGSTTACTISGGNRSCSQIASFDAPLPLAAGPIVFPTADGFASLLVAELDSMTVAGTTARCFRTLAANLQTADYCFTAQAVPVFGSGAFGVVRASKLSSTSDADFIVPTP